jgi:Na+-transporting NADH:ubiquinone oxidoreductase subunit NqrB
VYLSQLTRFIICRVLAFVIGGRRNKFIRPNLLGYAFFFFLVAIRLSFVADDLAFDILLRKRTLS